MDDKKEHIIYTKADIDNYLQGKMNKEAMHNFERATLQDAFLADAIEGYHFVDATTANNNLAAIEALILADKKETKVIPISKNKSEWLKIAVAAILFIGVGFVGMLLINKGNKELVVSNDKIATKQDEKSVPIIDSIKKDEVAFNEKKVIDKKDNFPKIDIGGKKFSVTILDPNVPTKSETVTNNNTAAIRYQQSFANGTTSTNQNIASNKSAGPSVNNATNYITFNDNKKEVATMELEKRKDESVKDFKGTYSNMAGNKPADNSVVVLPTIKLQRDSSFDKIPVTAYACKKAPAKPLAFTLTKEDSSMVPANGWAAFNDYLQHNNTSNITYDTTFSPVAIINNKTGEEIVGLEFDIDKFGMPDKIKITKSVDPETDAKAIDLLKKGPKWITTDKNQKGKIAIKF